MWQKKLKTNGRIANDFLVAICLLLIVISGITHRPLLLLFVGLIGLYCLVIWIYHRAIEKRLELVDEPTTSYLFPGDESTLTFHFKNRSIFPFIHGRLAFYTNATIQTKENPLSKSDEQDVSELPLALIQKGSTVLEVPFVAQKRGITRITNIRYRFPHLWMFQSMVLSYLPYYQQEIIVYPELKPVQGLDTFVQMAPGNQIASMSPFEDLESHIGTRDYTHQDPFHRINWKASAKAQRLQTNQYEKIIDASFVFLINLQAPGKESRVQKRQTIENYLSYTAYLANYARQKGFPYEIFINTRKPGRVPYVHLPEGAGMPHYLKVLEQLARIHNQPMVSSMAPLMYRVGKQWTKPKTIIIIGEMLPEMTSVVKRWHAMHRVLQVKENEQTATLTPWQKGGRFHAR